MYDNGSYQFFKEDHVEIMINSLKKELRKEKQKN